MVFTPSLVFFSFAKSITLQGIISWYIYRYIYICLLVNFIYLFSESEIEYDECFMIKSYQVVHACEYWNYLPPRQRSRLGYCEGFKARTPP